MTYPEAENKIIQAYFRDEIKPLDGKFCFCGTLNNGDESWMCGRGEYSGKEFAAMEAALLSNLAAFEVIKGDSDEPGDWFGYGGIFKGDYYESCLFQGMSDALAVLKQIHIDRGENVDTVPFKKRELIKAV